MVRGHLSLNEPLAGYTSWHVGGKAQQLYKPADTQDLAIFLNSLPSDEPITWLGLGSNVLISDHGLKGTVIMTQGGLTSLELSIVDSVPLLRVEAGVTCSKLAKFCAAQRLGGADFFAGIPGTVGGALAMNAGAFGGETWRHVIAVEMIDRQGKIHHRTSDLFDVGYRQVHFPNQTHEWFLAGYFRFPLQEEDNLPHTTIKQLLKKRNETQPIGQFSCGSVFRNPTGYYAAQLIESCGLKGQTQGDAVVSEKHANFIINKGNATARDILFLIEWIQKKVHQETGIRLIRECHILGDQTV